MPLLSSNTETSARKVPYVRLINGQVVQATHLVAEDVCIDARSGKIIAEIPATVSPDEVAVVNCKRRIIAPGFIDVQINGAFGFDFSNPDCINNPEAFNLGLCQLNQRLIRTGTTSYLPTMTSQFAETYHKALPYLGPTGSSRDASIGAESLGAHCEGPFFAHTQKGCHSPEAILALGTTSPPELVTTVYGEQNLFSGDPNRISTVKMVTLAPERAGALNSIKMLADNNIMASIGHTAATYEQAVLGVKAGSRMVTHLFNAMNQLHHREPGIFGLIASSKDRVFGERRDLADDGRPYFGIIADGIHLHPASIRLAYNAHPDGMILITDAVMFMGMEDGSYQWTNGQRTVKSGMTLMLEGTSTLAGRRVPPAAGGFWNLSLTIVLRSAIDILSCINNLLCWTGCSIPAAIQTVTLNPATMLGIADTKGLIKAGADADLVVLDTVGGDGGATSLEIDQVWKFGVQVCRA